MNEHGSLVKSSSVANKLLSNDIQSLIEEFHEEAQLMRKE